MTELTRFFIDQRNNLIRSPKIRLRRKELSIISSDTADTAFQLEEFCSFANIKTLADLDRLGSDGLLFGYKNPYENIYRAAKACFKLNTACEKFAAHTLYYIWHTIKNPDWVPTNTPSSWYSSEARCA